MPTLVYGKVPTRMSTQIYTELDLRKLRGQMVKDIWHSLIGKGPGIRNTTGLKSSDEIIQAILQAQENPEFLRQFTTKPLKHKHKADESIELEEMPPKQKPGPKPKVKIPDVVSEVVTPKTVVCNVVTPGAVTPGAVTPNAVTHGAVAPNVVAVESTEAPLTNLEVNRIRLRRLHVENTVYFLDPEKNNVYSSPGVLYGEWNPETKTLTPLP